MLTGVTGTDTEKGVQKMELQSKLQNINERFCIILQRKLRRLTRKRRSEEEKRRQREGLW